MVLSHGTVTVLNLFQQDCILLKEREMTVSLGCEEAIIGAFPILRLETWQA